jgi:hypothetical protein
VEDSGTQQQGRKATDDRSRVDRPLTIRFPSGSFNQNLLLLACGLLLSFAYLHKPWLHLNTALAGGVGDSLKNYFTFAYHARYWTNPLHFDGFNFPYGEHVIYTDCQPLISIPLRFFPFLYGCLPAILNLMVLVSFAVTPLLLYRLFASQGFSGWSALAVALGVAALSPQYYKISAGHYALAYVCVIPLGMLLLSRYLRGASLVPVTAYNLLLFGVHPYLGFGLSAFTLLMLLARSCYKGDGRRKLLVASCIAGLLPILTFMLFMRFTDHHTDRPVQPFGIDLYVANAGSLILSYTGPFTTLMTRLTNADAPSYEGYAYLGIAVIVTSCLTLLAFPFIRKRPRIPADAGAMLIAAIVLLVFAFGPYNHLSRLTGLHINAIEQLRAPGRFAWFFYYALPVALFPYVISVFNARIRVAWAVPSFAATVLVLNLWEAHYLVTPDVHIWGKPNIFHRDYPSAREKQVIDSLPRDRIASIIPVPMFFAGSDVYQRDDPEAGMTAPVMYSYHTGIPLFASNLTRTSLGETALAINTLCGYDELPFADTARFLVLHYRGRIKPDEKRLLAATEFFFRSEKYALGWLTVADWKRSREQRPNVTLNNDSTGREFAYISGRNGLREKRMDQLELVAHIGENILVPGKYIVSLQFRNSEKTWDGLNCNLFVARNSPGKSEWNYNFPIRAASAVRDDYVVVEDEFEVEDGYSYDFLLKGNATLGYSTYSFLIRKEGTNVTTIDFRGAWYNNFPAGK